MYFYVNHYNYGIFQNCNVTELIEIFNQHNDLSKYFWVYELISIISKSNQLSFFKNLFSQILIVLY